MIDVKLYYNPNAGNIKLRIRGHANAGEYGEDLICAAVSALAITAGECACYLHSRELLKRTPLVHLKRGDTTVIVTPREDALAEAILCFWTIQVGMHALAKRYPDYVNLSGVLKL